MANWTASDIPDQQGRTVVVTGTGGLGFEDARALARVGARVIIAGRNRLKGAEAIARVLAETPGARVSFEQVDLASLASIESFAAAAPFYAFATPFLIRTHGFSAGQAGVAFGLLQGALGILGTVLGGRGFDRAVRSGSGQVLAQPAILFIAASATTALGLFAPSGWLSLLLFIPAMLSFSFMLPWAFGAGHLVAGRGREALASSLGMIGSGLLGPALGPLLVGAVSDGASAAGIPNGLGLALLIVPVSSVLAGMACLIANNRIAKARFGKR